jgi:hypothetical protein
MNILSMVIIIEVNMLMEIITDSGYFIILMGVYMKVIL